MAISPAADKGLISGQILSQDGKPVAKVRVMAHLSDGRISMLVDRWADSDENGGFTIDGLPFGLYTLLAQKLGDYPLLPECMYESMKTPKLTLTPTEPFAQATVRLPPRASILTGHISSATTGQPIELATMRVMARSNGKCWLETTVRTSYKLSIPSNIDFDLGVSAAGYRAWSYSDSFGGAMLHAESQEGIVVDVRLKPSKAIP
jgi:hypothetical protein